MVNAMNNNKESLLIINILICVLMIFIMILIIMKIYYILGFAGLWLLGATISRVALERAVKMEGSRNEIR